MRSNHSGSQSVLNPSHDLHLCTIKADLPALADLDSASSRTLKTCVHVKPFLSIPTAQRRKKDNTHHLCSSMIFSALFFFSFFPPCASFPVRLSSALLNCPFPSKLCCYCGVFRKNPPVLISPRSPSASLSPLITTRTSSLLA